jgi:hypothetical protein
VRLGLREAEFYPQTTRVEAAPGIGGLESDSMVNNLPQDTIQVIQDAGASPQVSAMLCLQQCPFLLTSNTYTIDINGENTIIRFGTNVGENVHVIPGNRIKRGA